MLLQRSRLQRTQHLLRYIQASNELPDDNIPLQPLPVRGALGHATGAQLHNVLERAANAGLCREPAAQAAARLGRQGGQVELLRGKALLLREIKPTRILRLRNSALVLF